MMKQSRSDLIERDPHLINLSGLGLRERERRRLLIHQPERDRNPHALD